ncbi:MAG: hypothetical protein WCQ69_11285 [Bacteroidales bacterium]|jgi:hypothetical protein
MMMASSCCDTQTIFLNNDHSRTALPGMNFQQQYNNYGTERRSDPDAKTGAEQLFFVENIPYNYPSAHFLGLLRRL